MDQWKLDNSKFSNRNGVFWRKDCTLLGPDSPIRKEIFNELHASPSAGLSGFQNIAKRVLASFYWSGGWRNDIKWWVRECDENASLLGLLQPLPFSDEVQRHISVDFIEGLPISSSKQPNQWLKYFLTTFSSCMGCLLPQFFTATQYLQAHFGKNVFRS